MSEDSHTNRPGTEGLIELQRRARDALDLGIAAGAPLTLLEKLAAASALLQALVELPRHALLPDVLARAHRALTAWHEWSKHLPKTAA